MHYIYKNKRGMLLLKQIIEIIIAVIAVGIIIYAGAVLFRTYFGKQEDMQAQGTLDRIVQKLNNLETGEIEPHTLLATSGWYIVAFDAQHNFNENEKRFEKPLNLIQQNILCICKGKCGSKFCQAINLPLKQEGELANIKVRIIKLWLSNQETHYEVSEKPTSRPYKMSEQEKTAVELQNLKISEEGIDNIICEKTIDKHEEIKDYVANEQEFRELIKATVIQESQGYYNAVSKCGAVGLMQLMPLVAKDFNLKVYGFNSEDECQYTGTPEKMCDETYGSCMKQFIQGKTKQELIALHEGFDPEKNIEAGISHIITYLKRSDISSLEMGIAAYYAGPNVKNNCQFVEEIFTCEGYTSKPTPDEYVSQVMAKKEIIHERGLTC